MYLLIWKLDGTKTDFESPFSLLTIRYLSIRYLSGDFNAKRIEL